MEKEARALPLSIQTIEESVEHFFANHNGVKIHYTAIGSGPTLVLLHGFPDHWLGWWKLLGLLSKHFRLLTLDMRGYNLSDKPTGVENYTMDLLLGDVQSVIEHSGEKSATLVGHDWGGSVAWHMAMRRPELVQRLIVLNMPHPWAVARELAINPHQEKASEYVRLFKLPMSHLSMSLDRLSFWVKDEELKIRHEEAMKRSSVDAMFNYYRANWPNEPYTPIAEQPQPVKAPTLIIHGLMDMYALPAGLNDVWQWIDSELTIHTIPKAGHFVQQDAAVEVASQITSWIHLFMNR